jgi:UDP-2,3-diacylglucosamine pyrophosphatase LpxH
MTDHLTPPARQAKEAEREKQYYRSVWISDVHLGTKHAQVGKLLDFLRDCECRYLYIVGDFIDGWQLQSKWYWEDSYNVLIQKLLRKSRKHTHVIYITGNHDEFVDQFASVRFGSVTFAHQAIHAGADGRKYLVIHGHQCDGIAHFNRLLDRIGTRLYDWILDFNLHCNRVRRLLGFGYWSVAAYLKYKAKSAVKYVSDYEESLAQMARKQDADGVICGHIHRAEIRDIQGVRYLNCGDWVESCTALVEEFDGTIRLLHLHDENTVLHPGGGAGPHDPGHRDEGNARNGGTPGGGRGRGPEPEAVPAGILHIGDEDAGDHRPDPGIHI